MKTVSNIKSTSIYSWYKKVTSLVAKSIEAITIHGFTIEVSLMDVKTNDRSININVFNHANDDCKVVYGCSIASYKEDEENKKSFKEFKNFLEEIETLR